MTQIQVVNYSYHANSIILINTQFGFRITKFTAMTVIEMVDKISDAKDNKYYSLDVFVDHSKALIHLIITFY